MAAQLDKVLRLDAKELARSIVIEKARRAEIIRLQNEYFDAKLGRNVPNTVTAQEAHIKELKETLAKAEAKLGRMRHTARNSKLELKASTARLTQMRENFAARLKMDKMLEMKSMFNAMRKAGFTPPEVPTVAEAVNAAVQNTEG